MSSEMTGMPNLIENRFYWVRVRRDDGTVQPWEIGRWEVYRWAMVNDHEIYEDEFDRVAAYPVPLEPPS